MPSTPTTCFAKFIHNRLLCGSDFLDVHQESPRHSNPNIGRHGFHRVDQSSCMISRLHRSKRHGKRCRPPPPNTHQPAQLPETQWLSPKHDDRVPHFLNCSYAQTSSFLTHIAATTALCFDRLPTYIGLAVWCIMHVCASQNVAKYFNFMADANPAAQRPFLRFVGRL